MVRPEDIEELVIASLRWIKFHFHHLGMSGLISANILVRRILFRSTCISDACGQNTFHVTESFLHSPETTCAERSLLGLHIDTIKLLLAIRNKCFSRMHGFQRHRHSR